MSHDDPEVESPGPDSKAKPFDVSAFRGHAATAVRDDDQQTALDLLAQAPELLDLLDELLVATVALAGDCRCASTRVIGRRPAKDEPCPHVRAQRALRRAGVTDARLAEIREDLPIRLSGGGSLVSST